MKTIQYLILFISVLSFVYCGYAPSDNSKSVAALSLLQQNASENQCLVVPSEEPISNSIARRAIITDPNVQEALLRSGSILQGITGITNGTIPQKASLTATIEGFLTLDRQLRVSFPNGLPPKNFSGSLISAMNGGYEIKPLGLISQRFTYQFNLDLGSYTGKVILGILNSVPKTSSQFLAYIAPNSLPAGVSLSGIKEFTLTVVNGVVVKEATLPTEQTYSEATLLKQGGVLVTNITLPTQLNGVVPTVVKYSLESYEPILSALSIYYPRKKKNVVSEAKLVSVTKGNYQIGSYSTKTYNFESVIDTLPGEDTIWIGFYNHPTPTSYRLYSLIPSGVYQGKMVGNAAKQIELKVNRVYYGQAYTGSLSNHNCGPSASLMACKIVGLCQNETVESFRNYILSASSTAKTDLTWSHIQTLFSKYMLNGTYSIKTKSTNVVEKDIDDELSNNKVVMALIKTGSLTKNTSITTAPILDRYYSFDGNHYILIVNSQYINGVKYYVALDPSSWETYLDDGLTKEKGNGVYYKASEVVKSMNHADVLSSGVRKYNSISLQ